MACAISLLAGVCTLLGALIVLALGVPQRHTLAVMLGLAAGIMVGVTVNDLLPAALSSGQPKPVLIGLLAGILVLALLDKGLGTLINPSQPGLYKTGLVVALGIALHDLPEGMALAAGFADTAGTGPVLALAIGLHNVPEGMATAAPLRAAGLSPSKIIFLAATLSLITPLGTLIGFGLIQNTELSLSLFSAFAAGAMLYVSLVELVPRSLAQDPQFGVIGILAGLVLASSAQLLF
jgi:ZIP family zinc transporter